MSIVSTPVAILAGLCVFFAPGLTLLSLLSDQDRRRLPVDEALFFAVACSVMASAWIGLMLAEIGAFSIITTALILVGVSTAALVLARRRIKSPSTFSWSTPCAVSTALIAILAVALQAHPSEYIMGGRDPGTYIAAMALVARHGGIVYTDPDVLSVPPEDTELFFRNPRAAAFTWGRFMGFPLERPETGRVFPEFFHLFPVFGAFLFQVAGVKGALATSCVFGILGTMACFFALRRIFGQCVALVAAFFLSLNVVQVWFARYPVSEPVSQFLFFVGVLALAHWEEAHEARVFGALAGIALGLSLLVRIDSALIVVPLVSYLALRRLRGDLPWRSAGFLIVPFLVLLAHAALHAFVWSRKYVEGVLLRPYWRHPAWIWLLIAGVAVGALPLIQRAAPRIRCRLQRYGPVARRSLVVSLFLLSAYAYFARPLLSRWAGADGYENTHARVFHSETLVRERPSSNATVRFKLRQDDTVRVLAMARDGYLLALKTEGKRWGYLRASDLKERRGDPKPEWLARALLQMGFQHLARHDAESLKRFGWFVSPLGILLALLGLATLINNGASKSLFLVLSTLSFSAFYFYKLRVWNDYFFAARRFVPVLLPCALAFVAVFLARLWTKRGAKRLLAAVMIVTFAWIFANDTRRILRHVDWRGSILFVEDLARLFGPRDIVVFEQKSSIHLLSLPLWSIHGVHVLELARWNPDPDRLAHLLANWRERYSNVYFAYTYRAERGLCGVFLQKVRDEFFLTQEWQRSYIGPPRTSEPRSLRFSIARVVDPEQLAVPPLTEIDIGGSDDFQVSGFYEKEGGAERTYRWTGACGSIYVPAARNAQSISIVASGGKRPPDNPALVEVDLSGMTLGHFLYGADWTTQKIPLIPPLPSGPPILRLRVPTWRPCDVLSDSNDVRDLGVMIDRLTVERRNAIKD